LAGEVKDVSLVELIRLGFTDIDMPENVQIKMRATSILSGVTEGRSDSLRQGKSRVFHDEASLGAAWKI
jgi:hypothetical protein